MAGKFTRKMYDCCATQQDTKQSTDPLELVLDVNKYVNCNNICRPTEQYPSNSASLVDVESSLWGIDKLASNCDVAKHPFCGPYGCLLTRDPRVAPHITPYACQWGHNGENAVVTTNMQMPKDAGYTLPDPNICQKQGNGYYTIPNNGAPLAAPTVRAPITRAPTVTAPMGAPRTVYTPPAPRSPLAAPVSRVSQIIGSPLSLAPVPLSPKTTSVLAPSNAPVLAAW